jgi:hypothetical protein
MANLRHPFEVIQEAAQGLDPGALGTGYGQSISDKLNAMGFTHTFDGLDRYKFDGSGGIDPRYGTIDAIRNKGYVYKGTRGPESQALVFQPWHDKKEARALGLNPDGPSQGVPPPWANAYQAQVQRRLPGMLQSDPMAQPPGQAMGQPDPSQMQAPDPNAGPNRMNPQEPEPWYMQLLRGRR